MSLPLAVSPDSRELIFGKGEYSYERKAFERLTALILSKEARTSELGYADLHQSCCTFRSSDTWSGGLLLYAKFFHKTVDRAR